MGPGSCFADTTAADCFYDGQEEIPWYTEVVKTPMDFSTIMAKLPKDYVTLKEFVADVRLTFKNCLSFNRPSSDIVRAKVTFRSTVSSGGRRSLSMAALSRQNVVTVSAPSSSACCRCRPCTASSKISGGTCPAEDLRPVRVRSTPARDIVVSFLRAGVGD